MKALLTYYHLDLSFSTDHFVRLSVRYDGQLGELLPFALKLGLHQLFYDRCHPNLRFCPGPNCPIVIKAAECVAKQTVCVHCKSRCKCQDHSIIFVRRRISLSLICSRTFGITGYFLYYNYN